MSPEKRRALMSRIKGRDTGPEKTIARELRKRNVCFSAHAHDLPGRPDVVFRRAKVAVFIDGDFWHGWRFPLWEGKLSPKWHGKIAANRERDKRNFRKLRGQGWKVIRIWEHQVEIDPAACVKKIVEARKSRLAPVVDRE